MKKKVKIEVRSKSKEELGAEIVKAETEISQLRLEMAAGKVKNTSSLCHKLDDLAVLLTILKEKESVK